ncbi:hypothetical protein [Ruminococcus sp.]|uniref:hypothetical protein n=1 Tax=Ruminococcus sp. TaxID=41978 RepID=UPI0038907FB7
MNAKKIIAAVFSILLSFCLLSTSSYAAEDIKAFDINKKGNVSISFRYNSEVVSGGKLTAFKVADVSDSYETLHFILSEDFAESDIDPNNTSDSSLAPSLSVFASKKKLKGLTLDISDKGNVTFPALDTGLYLFTQSAPANGYNPITPFLVSVPMNSDGEYLYNIDASPKVQISKEYIEPTMPYVDKPKEGKLPQTGQLNWPVPVLTMLGLVLLIVGWIFKYGFTTNKNRKPHSEA